MPRYDAKDADCRVFTYKDGLLSAVAHDLELRVGSFEIEVSDGRITARFDPRSIEVVDAILDGRRAPGALSARDKEKIRSNIVSEVIPVKKHPDVRFESSEVVEEAGGWTIRGRLELAGRSRELVVKATREGDAALAEVVLHQPDFGIKPYTAMLGTLKIKPDIRVRIRIPV